MTKSNISFFSGLLLLFFVMASCGKKASTYEISGKLDNVSGNYFFMSYESGDSIKIDTIPIDKKGEFSYKGEVDTLTMVALYFNQNAKTTFVFVDKGWNVELKGNVLYPDLINVKGGDVNDDLTAFKNKNDDLLKSRADILNATEGDEEGDSVEVKDYVVDLKNINFELSNIAADYVKANPEKIASVMLINTFFKDETSIPRLEETLSLLKGKAADSPVTENLRRYKDQVKKSLVGSIAPHFSVKDLKGKTVQLSEFRGKYLSLTFASTTCHVCALEKEDAIKVYNELKSKKQNIEFVTIVKDIEEKAISDSTAREIKWPLLPVYGGWSAKIFENYYIREIPYNILISPSGVILERDYPILALPEKLDGYINSQK